jgi:three-Cys-motif partner protein
VVKSDNHFDTFADHTLLKHFILRAYLWAWASKILTWGGLGRRVVFVDGFAGAGGDDSGNPGSPVIAAKVAAEVRKKSERDPAASQWRMGVVAIEDHPGRFRLLSAALESFRADDPDNVQVLKGKCFEQMDSVVSALGQTPTLYFLDPFGIGGLDATWFPRLLAGPSNEMFVLFADIGAVRLRGVVHAGDKDLKQSLERLTQPDLFPGQVADAKAAIAEEQAQRHQRRAATAKAAVTKLTQALGDEGWMDQLKHAESPEAREEMLLMFAKALLNAGGQHVHLIPMRDAAGVHKHFLVHVSKSIKGWITMKEAVSSALESDELSPIMRERIKDDLRIDVASRQMRGEFSGQTVRWTDTAKRFLLERTGAFHFQINEIKNELKAEGILKKEGRGKEYCFFPVA